MHTNCPMQKRSKIREKLHTSRRSCPPSMAQGAPSWLQRKFSLFLYLTCKHTVKVKSSALFTKIFSQNPVAFTLPTILTQSGTACELQEIELSDERQRFSSSMDERWGFEGDVLQVAFVRGSDAAPCLGMLT